MLALRLDCSTAARTTPQKVVSNWKLVEVKMLDFSDYNGSGMTSVLLNLELHIAMAGAYFWMEIPVLESSILSLSSSHLDKNFL